MLKRLSYLLLVALAACSKPSGTPTLSVSIEPQRKILEELAGDRFEIVTVMPRGSNPETYDPSVSQRMAVDRSAAYFITGYLPFEEALSAGSRAVNTSDGIARITGTHSHGDDHGDGHDHEVDPHVWTSVRNAAVMARNMTDALVDIDPDGRDIYLQRCQAMLQRLDSLDAATAERLRQGGAHAFVVWHPSLSYFARDYGLHQIAVGQESKELSISNLRDIISEARADSVRVFFFQKEYDSRQAQSLNQEIGSRLVTIDPLAYDWETEITRIADELAQ